MDFTREIALTRDLGIGDTTLVRDGGQLPGFALWHSTPLAAGRAKDEVRVLKLVARSIGAFDRLLAAMHGTAAAERVGRVAIRCQTDYAEAYLRLVAAGYRVHWTDLRMILHGFPQALCAAGRGALELGDLTGPGGAAAFANPCRCRLFAHKIVTIRFWPFWQLARRHGFTWPRLQPRLACCRNLSY